MNMQDETLSFKNEGDICDLNECIFDISKKISSFREEVKDHMNVHYVHLKSVKSSNLYLCGNASKLLEDVKDLQLRLDTQVKREVASLTEELREMKDSLNESNLLVEQVNKLLVIDTELSALQSEQQKPLQIMQHLSTAQKYLQNECTDIEYLDIYKVISETIIQWQSECHKKVRKSWEESVSITCLEMEKNNRTAMLRVSIGKSEMEDILMTLSLLGELTHRISLFSNTLFKEILAPIIEQSSTVLNDVKSNCVVLVVTTNYKSTQDSKPPDYAQVLNHLTTAFQYIKGNLDCQIDNDTKFLKEVGGYIGEKLVSLLDEVCLTHMIPRKRLDIEAFAATVGEIIAFDNLLKEMEFIEASNNTLKRYSGSIDDLFLQKTVEVYLDSARTIMKKDLQDMKEIEPKDIKDDEPLEHNNKSSFVLDQISLGLFQFPKCCISKSVEELVLLIKDILTEIVTDRQINVDTALKMFGTARDILMNYRLTSFYHKEKLDSIPQYSVLLHNNLMFLAHEAMTLHLEFRAQYPPCLHQNLAHFVDLINPLRTTAAQVLDEQIKKQQIIIVDTIKKAGLSSLSDCEKLSDNSKKYLKQCLYQLSFLKNVWFTVLAHGIYRKIMGQLCQMFVEEIISKVLATKDITADTTLELAAVFSSIQEDIPSLFPEPKEVHRYVKNWTKFSELVYVLGGTLTEIEERWADGKGPLASEFTPIQLKHLIKALFQTSDRRAAVLASIN